MDTAVRSPSTITTLEWIVWPWSPSSWSLFLSGLGQAHFCVGENCWTCAAHTTTSGPRTHRAEPRPKHNGAATNQAETSWTCLRSPVKRIGVVVALKIVRIPKVRGSGLLCEMHHSLIQKFNFGWGETIKGNALSRMFTSLWGMAHSLHAACCSRKDFFLAQIFGA